MGYDAHYTRLRELRRTTGRTQQQVADALGLNKKTLSTYETGRIEVGAETLSLFADYYGCSVDDILGRNATNVSGMCYRAITEDEERLLDLFRRLTPNLRLSFLDIMRNCVKAGSRGLEFLP